MAYLEDEFRVRYELPTRPTTLLVGRATQSEVVIPPLNPQGKDRFDLSYLHESVIEDASKKYGRVSRQHAIIRLRGGEHLIRDTDSTFGTFVRGVQIRPDEEVALIDGDSLVLGNLSFIYHKNEQPRSSGEN